MKHTGGKESVYKAWQYSKLLAEKGIKVSSGMMTNWIAELEKDNKTLSFVEAGIKKLFAIEDLKEAGWTPQQAVEVKKSLMEKGMDEGLAEEWLRLYVQDPAVVSYLLEEGVTDYYLTTEMLSRFSYNFKRFKETFKAYKETGLSGNSILQEMYLISKFPVVGFLFPHAVGLWLPRFDVKEVYKKSHVKSQLFYRIHKLLKPEERERLKQRVKLYRSFGFSRLLSEWWAVSELFYGAVPERYIPKLSKIKDLQGIVMFLETISYVSDEVKKEEFLEKHLDNLIAYCNEEWNYLEWINIPIEEAREWQELGLSGYEARQIKKIMTLEEFKNLLQDAYCSALDLYFWLDKVGLDEVKNWFSIGIRSEFVFDRLRDRGFTYERTRELLKEYDIDIGEILKGVDEGLKYDELKDRLAKERLKKVVFRNTVQVFRKR